MSNLQTETRHAPIFIVGYMHSGTTLLRNILGRNPSVFCVRGETSFFDELPVIRKRYADLNDETARRDFVLYLVDFALNEYPPVNPSEVGDGSAIDEDNYKITPQQMQILVEEARKLQNHRKIFCAVYNRLTQFSGKDRWLEKTPTHIFHINEISQLLPEAQFVELVRDPRDILASKQARRSAGWVNRHRVEVRERVRLSTNFDPLMDTLGWKSAIHAGDRARERDPNCIIKVRYEDLVTNPEKEIIRISEFLGLDFNQMMLDVVWANTTTLSSRNGERGIGTASIGKWRRQLSLDTVAVCQLLTKQELDRLGYECIPIDFMTSLKTPIWFLRSGIEIWMRIYRRWRKGGSRYSWNMVKNYIYRFVNITK